MKKIYLDYAASTPVDPGVLKEMEPYFSQKFGNPGSLHAFGQEALAAVDESREKIASALGAEFHQILFTGSATESNNLALRGIVKNFKKNNPEIKPKIIVSAVEHESVSETARRLGKDGVEVAYLKVDKEGLVNLGELKSLLDEKTILVSVIYASNVIGVIEPIKKISEIVKEFKEDKNEKKYPLFHTDAVQALQFLDCNVNNLGVDLMTLSAQKIYGPKGIGVLYIKNPAVISPIITGGEQEFGLRGGTLNVPGIVGFAKAMELILKNRDSEAKRIKILRDELLKGIKKNFKAAQLNGSETLRLPNNLHIYFPGFNSADLLMKFSLEGLATSAGSACVARSLKPSAAVYALNLSEDRPTSSLRFTLGRPTTNEEIKEALVAIKKVLKRPLN